MSETTFELRELKSSDIFPMFNIIRKIGFKDLKDMLTPEKVKELTSMFKQNADADEQKENVDADADEQMMFIGFNVVFEVAEIILNNLPSCEQEIYSFLAELSGMKVKEVRNLSMVTFTEMIIEVLKKEEFKDFFKVVSRLFD